MSNRHKSIDDIKIYDHEKAFENAIKKGMKNPDDWMYMYSTKFKDYFKHSLTRGYTSYFNIKNIFYEFSNNRANANNTKETESKVTQFEPINYTKELSEIAETKIEKCVNVPIDEVKINKLDAPGRLDIALYKIHEDLMELSEEETVTFNISGTGYKVKAIFDEISNGDKYYTYEIEKSDIMELKGLTFFQTYKFLENELEIPYLKEEKTMLSKFKSKEQEIEHER